MTLRLPPPDLVALPAELLTQLPWAAARIRAQLHPGMPYRCVVCHQPGALADGGFRVAVQLHLHRRQLVVKFVHTCCGSPELRILDHAIAIPDETTVWAVPAVVTGGPWSRTWPILLVESYLQFAEVPRCDDLGSNVDLVTGGLTAAGMRPVISVHHPLGAPDPGWRVILPGPGQPGRVEGPGGLLLFRPLTALRWPAGWHERAASLGGRCGVYHAQHLGLGALTTRTDLHGDDLLDAALRHAGRAGRLVGVTATATVTGGRP